MDIAILLYDRFTALDAIGPYETLGRLPDATLTFVAAEPGEQRTDQGSLAIVADATFDELRHPDIVVVPGGPGTEQAMGHEPTLEWLRAAHDHVAVDHVGVHRLAHPRRRRHPRRACRATSPLAGVRGPRAAGGGAHRTNGS